MSDQSKRESKIRFGILALALFGTLGSQRALAAGNGKGTQLPFSAEQERRRNPQVSYDAASTRAGVRQTDPRADEKLPSASLRYTTRGELKFAVADENGRTQLLDPQALSNFVAQFGQAVSRIPCGDQLLPERVTMALGEIEIRYYVKTNCEAGMGQYYVPGSDMQKKFRPSGNGPAPASVPGAYNPGAAPVGMPAAAPAAVPGQVQPPRPAGR